MARLRARTNARTSLALQPVNCPPVPTFRMAGRARVTGVTEHLIGTGRLHVPVHTARHDSHQRPGDAVNRLAHPPRPTPTAEINVQYAAFVADFSLVEVVSSASVPYAQLKGSWSSMKNGKPLFHHVLQCVSCWKKELPDGDCRQGRRDYTKCPGTRSRGTWAGDRCYPTASKVHRRQLVADARPDSAQKTGCQGHRFPIHRCTVGPRRHFDGRRESLHASTRGVPSCGAGAHRAPGVGRVASNRRPAEQVHERSHRRQQYHRTARRTGRPVPRLWRHLARGWPR